MTLETVQLDDALHYHLRLPAAYAQHAIAHDTCARVDAHYDAVVFFQFLGHFHSFRAQNYIILSILAIIHTRILANIHNYLCQLIGTIPGSASPRHHTHNRISLGHGMPLGV